MQWSRLVNKTIRGSEELKGEKEREDEEERL